LLEEERVMAGERPKSRIPRKSSPLTLRGANFLLTEVGLIIALLTVIGALQVDLRFEQEFDIPDVEQAVVEMEEVDQTEQIKRPPPPPRPRPPVVVTDDVVLEDEVLDIDAEIDLNFEAEVPPPPPPDRSEEEADPDIFVVVEEMPELIGGLARLKELVVYPEIAVKAGMEGLVIVQFVVEKDGRPANATVIKSAGGILDSAAVEAVRKLEFTPGRQRGVPVRVKFSLPVRFNLTSRQAT
jgi:protein TonB